MLALNRLRQVILTTSLKLNMLSSGLFWLTQSLTSFILIRIILKYIPLSEYGYWAAFLALTSYFTLSDLGLGPTITKYISSQKLDFDKKRSLSSAIILIELISAFILLIGLVIFYSLFYQRQLVLVFGLVLAGQFFIQMGMNFLALINGLQKIVLANLVLTSKSLIYFSLALTLVKQMHLKGLGLSFLIAGGAFFLISGALVRHYFKINLKLIKQVDKNLFKQALKFSSSMFYLKLAGQTRGQFDRIALSLAASPELAAIVDLARKLINPIRGVYVAVISPVFPVYNHLISQGKQDRLYQVMQKSLLVSFILLLSLFGLLVVVSPLAIKLWLGSYYLKILTPLYILVTAEFINLITYPVNLKIIAAEDHSRLVKFVLISVSIQVGASLAALYYINYIAMLFTLAGIEFIRLLIWFKLFNLHLPIKNRGYIIKTKGE